MLSKPPRPCKKPMCSGLTTDKHGYCEKHAHLYKPWSTGSAGKGRGGRPWRRTRDRILKRDKGLCQPCMRKGFVFPASEVDHIIEKTDGGTDDDSNLEAICNPCHTAKTQASAAQARAKG